MERNNQREDCRSRDWNWPIRWRNGHHVTYSSNQMVHSRSSLLWTWNKFLKNCFGNFKSFKSNRLIRVSHVTRNDQSGDGNVKSTLVHVHDVVVHWKRTKTLKFHKSRDPVTDQWEATVSNPRRNWCGIEWKFGRFECEIVAIGRIFSFFFCLSLSRVPPRPSAADAERRKWKASNDSRRWTAKLTKVATF